MLSHVAVYNRLCRYTDLTSRPCHRMRARMGILSSLSLHSLDTLVCTHAFMHNAEHIGDTFLRVEHGVLRVGYRHCRRILDTGMSGPVLHVGVNFVSDNIFADMYHHVVVLLLPWLPWYIVMSPKPQTSPT